MLFMLKFWSKRCARLRGYGYTVTGCFPLQFVPFRDFLSGKYGRDPNIAQAYLAKEVLAEVPGQITGWMRKRGIEPKPAPQPTTTSASAGNPSSMERVQAQSHRTRAPDRHCPLFRPSAAVSWDGLMESCTSPCRCYRGGHPHPP